MPIKPAGPATRIATFDILSGFLSPYEKMEGRLAMLRDEVYSKYCQLSPVDANGLNSILRNPAAVEMRDKNLVLYLEPLENKQILPLVTLHSSEDWVHFSIYALLTMLNEESELKSLAMRFETDEGEHQSDGEVGAHDFCHAQLCRAITSRMQALTPSWLPDSQPSIPVDAEDQVSLVLCMLTSLYGGRHVVKKVSATGTRDLDKHLKAVRALRNPKAG